MEKRKPEKATDAGRNTEQVYTSPVSRLEEKDYMPLIELALAEDHVNEDCSTEAVFQEKKEVRADIVARKAGILCGIEVASAVFLRIDPQISVQKRCADGNRIWPDDDILHLEGDIRSILRAERIALNFLSMLSGISSKVAEAVEILAPMGIRLLDTRKTIPGYRSLSKYAVIRGGGYNHRKNLKEMGMIKDNHIAAAGSIRQAVRNFHRSWPDVPLEVEVDTMEQLAELLGAPAAPGETALPAAILLDNMTPEELTAAARMIHDYNRENGACIISEASGGFQLNNLTTLEGTGVDYVSMGSLTNQITPIDFGLDLLS